MCLHTILLDPKTPGRIYVAISAAGMTPERLDVELFGEEGGDGRPRKIGVFERAHNGEFLHPHVYPARALVSFNTHDLPTFEGWVSGHDLEVKRSIGVDPGENIADREATRQALSTVLSRCELGHEVTFLALARFMARTQSRLLVISAEDVLEVKDQPNMPGTIDEYPNWRRKLPVDLDAFAGCASLRRIAEVLDQEGRSRARG